MHYNTSDAVSTGIVGGVGILAATITPSEYVSYFDRVYDVGLFLVSGDDIARLLGLSISVLVGANIIFNVCKDWKERRGKNKK
jgi:hypothetical protein